MENEAQSIVVIGNSFFFAGKTYRCAVGKNGFSGDKKEGDHCTPLGVFPLRELWYRADRLEKSAINSLSFRTSEATEKSSQRYLASLRDDMVLDTQLLMRVITENDGWCDDVHSPDYNRHVKLPLPVGEGWGEGNYSHETLWREDDVYDLIIPLGYNDDPIIAGKGSAIFMHIAKPDYEGTEGCIALAKNDLLEILPHLSTETYVEIRKE